MIDEDDDDTLVPDEQDRTVAVQREEPVDRTVVIERGPAAAAEPEGAQEAQEPEDRTVGLTRARLAKGARERGVPAAPDGARSGRAAAPAGPDSYPPRALPEVPAPAPPVPRGEDARRSAASALPSVARRSRRAGAVTLLVFGAACVISIMGIVAVVVWFVRA